MPSRLTHIEHVFDGGWAPDYGASAVVSIEKDGRCKIPWLMTAENVEFEADGTPHKVGGTVGISETVVLLYNARGVFDFWKQGTSGSPLQYRIIHVSNTVRMDQGDGTFTQIFTVNPAAIPHYSQFEEYAIIAQTGDNMPMYTDGVTHTAFTSPTPNFAFSEPHKLRMWAAGVDAAPSTLYYSAQEDPTDWTGAGSGSIAISPGDGDKITAIASHRNELFVFKGPNKGSIHRISGSAPTGDDAFARSDFVPHGLGAVSQRSIFRFGNDLGFMWSDGSVHSLNTTERYGDFLETSLSRPINKWIREHINPASLELASAATLDTRGVTRIGIPIDTSTVNNTVISMDFRFSPPRWSHLPAYGTASKFLAIVVDVGSDSQPRMMGCGNNGVVYKLDEPTRTTNYAGGAGYTCDVITPFLSYVQSPRRSTIYFSGVCVSPKTSADMTLRWTRDGYAQQSKTFAQWTGDVLATAPAGATNFTLGTSTLTGERAVVRSVDLDEGGEFQQIQYEVDNTGAANDLHLKTILASIKPGVVSTEIMT